MRFLNEYGLEAPAILSMARRAEPVEYSPDEVILSQGKENEYVYFLIKGHIEISLVSQDRSNVLGEREPVTVLGEISYFNRTPATATVKVSRGVPAVMLRLTYDHFTDVLQTYPSVKPVLARIGEMRVISQNNGFSSYRFFMDMIGWKRDRLAVNQSMLRYLDDTITRVLLPHLGETDRILDVGDGPGVVCEILHDHHPDRLDTLFLQATKLEDAILNPVNPYPSDLKRARYLKERFKAIVALQVFNHVPPDEVGEQFDLAASILEEGGLLLVVRLRVVNISYESGLTETQLLFHDLETLVNQVWPSTIEQQKLVQVTFMDADFDPMMEWNSDFCDRVIGGGLALPDDMKGVERPLLEVLLEQASQRVFDPDGLHFHWLVWQASHHGFTLLSAHQSSEVGFYYQLYRRGTSDA
jgi:CRP-like cAMP-binding protein